ncbi:rhamnosyltransferase WsaF family glycosyltransferase [Lysobacter sp. P5_B9]
MIERMMRRAGQRLNRLLGSESSQSIVPPTSVPELTPCVPRRDDAGGRRINLLLPSINAGHYFGGIHTAVQFYRSLCRHYPQSRIILLDAAPDAEALQRFGDHVLVPSETAGGAARQVVPFSDRYGRTLPVCAGDTWVCTGWWTAYAAQRIAAWQQSQFGEEGRITYLIQDFEPGFYAWSSRSAMALSTYRPERDIAVFNTAMLAGYFDENRLRYRDRWVFEPTLNAGLRNALESARGNPLPRRRRILVYARPSTPRNAFELLCEGLRAWGWSDPAAREWEVVAVGELARDIDLGPFVMKAMGKLAIADYGELLSTSGIGVSLMISPHPSYPPLEMSAFGMGVITNGFAGKDLSSWGAGIRSFDELRPEAIAESLSLESARWEARNMAAYPVMAPEHGFLQPGGLDAIADEVVSTLSKKAPGSA